MSLARRARLNRWVVEAAVVVLSAFLIVWSLVPLYNMVRVALQEKEDVFSSNVIPVAPTLHSFWTVFTNCTGCWPSSGGRWATASGSASSSLR